jgi:excisionase family DNA binding protein
MLRLSQVAERLNCSLANVYALKDAGHLICIATGANGKGLRVSEEEINRFLQERMTYRTSRSVPVPARQVQLKHLR